MFVKVVVPISRCVKRIPLIPFMVSLAAKWGQWAWPWPSENFNWILWSVQRTSRVCRISKFFLHSLVSQFSFCLFFVRRRDGDLVTLEIQSHRKKENIACVWSKEGYIIFYSDVIFLPVYLSLRTVLYMYMLFIFFLQSLCPRN